MLLECDPSKLRIETIGVEKPNFPMDIGEMYEGERIRRPDMQVEFGGVDVPKKWEIVLTRKPEEIEDGRVILIGPDLNELKQGGTYPLGILVEVAGEKVEKDLEGVLERRIHYFLNYIEGVMHLNQRYDIWIRIGKKVYQKGLNSLAWLGKALIWLYKQSFPVIEKIQVSLTTDQQTIEKFYPYALEVWAARDKRARELKDEDVEEFYGCVMCQSFAPTHMCVITPNRIASCGSISWFDARAASKVDPKGPNFPIPKGECIDPIKGIYTGVNEIISKKSLGSIKQVALYTSFETPHTSCGCFEGIAFYIPEVDGIAIVHRDFKGPTVNGLTFSNMAEHTSGGTQNPGFNGIAIEYLRSPKFLQADGGWERIVWIPKAIKDRVGDSIPQHMKDLIPTEQEVKNIEELKSWLKSKNHQVVKRWKQVAEEKAPEVRKEAFVEAAPAELVPATVVPEGLSVPIGGGFIIIFKNAKIVAEKVIIKRAEKVGK
ncbi:MAG: CO dehydrogenase/CO-methylating acetyl-CoA synthase complex subunit beta [Nitrososphaerales archaeon]